MAQYSIPQFIEQEGKIIYFLTFRQFFLLVGGGAICLLIYLTLPLMVFFVLSIIVMGLAAVIAFVKIDNAPILNIVLNYLTFSLKTKNYTWKKKESASLSRKTEYYKIKDLGPKEEKVNLDVQPGKLKEIKKKVETKK